MSGSESNMTKERRVGSDFVASSLTREKVDVMMDCPANQVRIGNKFYNAEKLLDFHPGGQLFISAFAGRDASQAFMSYHRKRFPHQKMKFALDNEDTLAPKEDPHLNDDYFDLVERIEKVLPRHKSFAPWTYYLKAFFIIGVCLALEGYMHYTGHYDWHLSAILGLFYAYLGLNIQHDANHGALSANPLVNRLMGMTQNWYGASVTSWVHQHVVQHHVHTNDVHLDPDIEGKVVMRLNPMRPLKKLHAYQWFYFFGLIFLYGFSIVKFSFTTVLEGFYYTPFSELLNRYRYQELAWSLFFYFRWFFLPYYMAPTWTTFFQIAPMFMIFGFYLSVFFHISHNYLGVEQLEDTSPKRSWLHNQVVASSNVAGPILGFLNGGLNYQIEHHLFPRIHHSHYPTIAPVVRQFCEEKGIPYRHFETVTENVISSIQHMYDIGTNVVPEAAKKLENVKMHARTLSVAG
uniref:Delta5-desaturase 1 n=1 Tax=Tigriopus japonicus TaxID=158387 RepID=A0A3S5X8U3_TIGJA|nr:delta5-desaturase 1 [Tigriopus japonicus]